MPTGQLVLVLLACGLILSAAAHYTPKLSLFLAIVATVLGGVALVLEFAAP